MRHNSHICVYFVAECMPHGYLYSIFCYHASFSSLTVVVALGVLGGIACSVL